MQDPDDYNPRLGDRFATEQAQTRAMGRALAHRTALGWMDLWGEGWLDEESTWERIETFASRYQTALQMQNGLRTSEVVVLVDEKSLLHIQRGEAFFRKITNGLRDVLQRAGVTIRTYLQSDLLAENFPLERETLPVPDTLPPCAGTAGDDSGEIAARRQNAGLPLCSRLVRRPTDRRRGDGGGRRGQRGNHAPAAGMELGNRLPA